VNITDDGQSQISGNVVNTNFVSNKFQHERQDEAHTNNNLHIEGKVHDIHIYQLSNSFSSYKIFARGLANGLNRSQMM